MSLPGIQYAKTTDGVSIAFLTVGSGPPIVFASNIFGDSHLYHQLPLHHVRCVTDRLASLGWKVIRYDVRGMGSSDRTVEDLTLDARVRDLEAVVTQLGLDRFVLGGLSIGVATAIAFTARYPSRVSRLVLLSPWVSGAELFALPDLRVASSMMASGEREWIVATDVLSNVASRFEVIELGNQLAAAMRQGTSAEGLAEFNKASLSIDLKAILPQVTVPTLVIHEPAFPYGSRDLCQDVAKSIKNAQFVEVGDKSIAGTIHDGNVRAIDSFLRPRAAGELRGAAPLEAHAPPTVGGSPLTGREIQVLMHVASGLTNKEIAAELDVAVSNHRTPSCEPLHKNRRPGTRRCN
jgi:pimeloyl-ACP methyl ester carboxylesterase